MTDNHSVPVGGQRGATTEYAEDYHDLDEYGDPLPALPEPHVAGTVALLLVCHQGERWLPTVINDLEQLDYAPDYALAVDTGSTDETPGLLAEAFGADRVSTLPGQSPFGAAVRAGLESLPDTEWVWILHDDSTPHPRALSMLLSHAAAYPDTAAFGPKIREWPSLRRLLEVGVTISPTGIRETGLERGEVDQGQHDAVREVLAVNTAGMLVRRALLRDIDGFDPHLPVIGADTDFGWRMANEGHSTMVVPRAVIFHAEAAKQGLRESSTMTGGRSRYADRHASIYSILANSSSTRLPWRWLRTLLGTLLRAFGLLITRAPGSAKDEILAWASVCLRPAEVRAGRRWRSAASQRLQQRGAAPYPRDRARQLLAPWWMPYRHGLDFLSDLAAAATTQAVDVAQRRRALQDPASVPATRRAPVRVEDDDSAPEDTSIFARYLTSPVALGVSLFLIAALVAARSAFGAIAAEGLSPAPAGVSQWWSLVLQSWHPVAQGTDAPGPAYLPILATLGIFTGGSATAVVSWMFFLAVPFAFFGAWRLFRLGGNFLAAEGAPRWLIFWASAVAVLYPFASGAWSDGRLNVLVTTALLAYLVHACLGFTDPSADRRWRASWRTALLLAIITAFAPVAGWMWLSFVVIGLAAAALLDPVAVRRRDVWLPPALPLAIVPLMLTPWVAAVLARGEWGAFFVDTGRLPGIAVDRFAVLGAQLGVGAAGWWWGVALTVLAAGALIPRQSRIPVLLCWGVALVSLAWVVVLGWITFELPGGVAAGGLAVPLVLFHAALLMAAFFGVHAAVVQLRGVSWGGKVIAGVGVALAIVPVVGLGWSLSVMSGLDAEARAPVPIYMQQRATEDVANGVLVVRGSVATGLVYTVVRDDGVTLGEDEILALTPNNAEFADDVTALLTAPRQGLADALAGKGIQYVVLPAPTDPEVSVVLDATPGLTQAGTDDRAARAWQLDAEPTLNTAQDRTSWILVVLLAIQTIALALIVVLSAPTWRGAR